MGVFDFKTGMKCSNCGHRIAAGEANRASTAKLARDLKDILFQKAFSNEYANWVDLKCPNCGECGRWTEDRD